jgi:hypothetical protein
MKLLVYYSVFSTELIVSTISWLLASDNLPSDDHYQLILI